MSKRSSKRRNNPAKQVVQQESQPISFKKIQTTSCGIVFRSVGGNGEILNGFMKPIEDPTNYVIDGAKVSYEGRQDGKEFNLKKTKKGYRVV